MAIYLTEADVHELVDIRLAIGVIEEAFRQLGARAVDNVPRARARAPGVVLHSMSAAAPYWAWSVGRSTPRLAAARQFLVGIYECRTGHSSALIEADRLGQLRTGATTGVAVEWLADSGGRRDRSVRRRPASPDAS